ncbi:MAG TPA: T9SS type A sorting domain-containing protein [Bacteroidia bacterium]|nr:T9SS type A sorting domain-containing protein [Bacteroidia bacterium]
MEKIKLFTSFLVCIFSSVFFSLQAQSPSWAWAAAAGSSNNNQFAGAVCTDPYGNVYSTGCFEGASITFGSNILNQTGGRNIYLVKYAPNGNVLWASSPSGINYSNGYGLCTDSKGNVYLTGDFNSTSLTFGSITLNNPGGGYCVFVTKYDPSGNVIWAKSASAGATYDAEGLGISVDTNDNVFVTGYFEAPWVAFGVDTLKMFLGESEAIFLTKYDSIGNVQWAKTPSGTQNNIAAGVCSDQWGNVYITGEFSSPYLVFGNDSVVTSGASDMFIAKYDSRGNALWAKSAGGIYSDEGAAVSVDRNGNPYVTGNFSSSKIIFGSDTLINYGTENIFTVKYDSMGNVMWAKSLAYTANIWVTGISASNTGNTCITGTFGPNGLNFGSTILNSNGYVDIFVADYDASGSPLWAASAGGTDGDYSVGVSQDPFGNVFVNGYFISSSMLFGSNAISDPNAPNDYDVYMAKLGTTVTAMAALRKSNLTEVFPNPFTNSTTISIIDNSPSTIHHLELSDITGRTLKQIEFTGDEYTFSAEGLAKGMYFIRVFSRSLAGDYNECIGTSKIVVQ